MKLTVFQSDKGDCLLLTSQDGRRMLVDGGMAKSYKAFVAPELGKLAKAGHALDLVNVSHIDSDHIAGILELMDDVLAWRVYDFQIRSGNAGFPRPAAPRPPKVMALWHNTFKDQAQDNEGLIADMLINNLRVINLSPKVLEASLADEFHEASEQANGLVTSVRESLMLSLRVSPQELRIPVNAEFGNELILVEGDPRFIPLGSVDLWVFAPFQTDLEKLRDLWNKWLKANQKAVKKVREGVAGDMGGATPEELQAAEAMLDEGQAVLSVVKALATELGERKLVTPPNLGSIMMLAEEDGKRLLLTGDGHADDILKGLEWLRRLDADGRIHVDVLKVQHHGAEHNIHQEFMRRVTADHYIFCGNGFAENPNLTVVETLIDTRLAEGSALPGSRRLFKLWFNSSAVVTDVQAHKAHMQKVEDLVRAKAAASKGRLKFRFLTRGAKFELTI